ncbi:MAG TPA: cytochrome C, partial [Nitrospinaceae bacterium]|nr:cytochrome C [Nitrospinaceae bacterium]
MQQPSFFKNLVGMILKFLPLAAVIWFIVAWFGLSNIMRWSLSGVVLVYAFLLALPTKRLTEKSLGQNLKFKLPIIIVIAGAIWV